MGEDKSFEGQWNEAFNQAEVAPPAHIWTAIDGHLANQQAGNYKRTAIFYKWLTAACILVFLSFGTYYWQSKSSVKYSLKESELSSFVATEYCDEEQECIEPLFVKRHNVAPGKSTELITSTRTTKKNLITNKELTRNHAPNNMVKSLNRISNQSLLTQLVAKQLPMVLDDIPEAIDHLYGTARTWERVEEDPTKASLWAGVSFSSGSFNPGFTNVESATDLSEEAFIDNPGTAQNLSASPSYSSGQAISGGINVGTRFDSRIVLSGGLHYNAFNTGSAASPIFSANDEQYAFAPETANAGFKSALSSDDVAQVAEQVQLMNEYQYLSIPLKAGYVILDKKLNVTVHTGVSSNILMKANLAPVNQETPLANDFETSNSYQKIYFNGLTSISFGMLFKEKYQVSVEPSYTQALTKFTNINNTNQGKPTNVGLSVGLSYHF